MQRRLQLSKRSDQNSFCGARSAPAWRKTVSGHRLVHREFDKDCYRHLYSLVDGSTHFAMTYYVVILLFQWNERWRFTFLQSFLRFFFFFFQDSIMTWFSFWKWMNPFLSISVYNTLSDRVLGYDAVRGRGGRIFIKEFQVKIKQHLCLECPSAASNDPWEKVSCGCGQNHWCKGLHHRHC